MLSTYRVLGQAKRNEVLLLQGRMWMGLWRGKESQPASTRLTAGGPTGDRLGGWSRGWHSTCKGTELSCWLLLNLVAVRILQCDAKSQLTGKDPDWGQEEKGTSEDEMVGWHHQLNEYESEQTLGDGEGQGSLACCSPWGRKESDMN